MEIWIVSDTHFSHTNILKYCGRLEFMNKSEVGTYRKIMKETNPVAREEKIRGMQISKESTDRMNETMIRNWNEVVAPRDTVIHLGDFYLGSKHRRKAIRERLNGTILLILGSHDGSKFRIARDGFIVIDHPVYIEDYILTHKPMEEVPDGKTNLHGHIHQLETSGRRKNMCVEWINYTPVNLREIE